MKHLNLILIQNFIFTLVLLVFFPPVGVCGDDNVELPSRRSFTVGSVTFNMVGVRGGFFMMGCDTCGGAYESPSHGVTLSDYMIGETEVTQSLWYEVMGWDSSFFKGEDRPVENVSWDDCQQFVKELNRRMGYGAGKGFRLPTEAEWEYAARGGYDNKKTKYSGSNDIYDVAWYRYNSGETTHEVGRRLPNENGLYDMSGNVYEWCQDAYDDYRSDGNSTNPLVTQGRYSDNHHIIRGGSFLSSYDKCRCSCRESSDYYYWRSVDTGLRLVFVP